MQSLNQTSTNWFNSLSQWKKYLFIGTSLIITGLLYLKVIAPTFNLHIPCLFRKITGYECPGCGLTRATLALLDGDIYQAFRYNMLVFILAPLLVLHKLLENKSLFKYSKVLMAIMLVMTFLFWILRNTETFNWMAPTTL